MTDREKSLYIHEVQQARRHLLKALDIARSTPIELSIILPLQMLERETVRHLRRLGLTIDEPTRTI